MRMLMKIIIPTEAGNAAMVDGTFVPALQAVLAETKPEAAYFVADHGCRAAYLIVDMTACSQIPAFAETAFLALNARIELTPAMVLDDLKAAMPAIAAAVKGFGKK